MIPTNVIVGNGSTPFLLFITLIHSLLADKLFELEEGYTTNLRYSFKSFFQFQISMNDIYILIIGVFLITAISSHAVFAQNTNSSNSTPPGTIPTPNGGWITPLQTHDENGNNITIHFTPGIRSYGTVSTGPPPIMHMYIQTDKQAYTNGNVTISGKEDSYLLQNYGNNLTLSIDGSQTGVKWCCYNFKSHSDGFFNYSFKMPSIFKTNDTYNARITPSNSTYQYGVGFVYSINPKNMETSHISSGLNLLSPLQQFKSGISTEDTSCKQGLQLIQKSEDDSPACVKSTTALILFERGWARAS